MMGSVRPAAACGWLARLLAMIAVGLLAACASPVTDTRIEVRTEVIDALRRFEIQHQLQAGEVVEVYVDRHPQFTRKAAIRADGHLTLPVIGDVKAAGLAPADLAREVSRRYESRLLHPDVTIIVENPPEPSVFVAGQVNAPRAIPLRQAKTLAQAIALSGDMNKLAATQSVAVLRLNDEGQFVAHTLATDGALLSQPEFYMLASAFPLRTNDFILVPESNRSQLMRTLQDIGLAVAPFLNIVLLHEVTK